MDEAPCICQYAYANKQGLNRSKQEQKKERRVYLSEGTVPAGVQGVCKVRVTGLSEREGEGRDSEN